MQLVGLAKILTQNYGLVQVILKPDPGNPQELYLGSLEALGIDTRAHDVRPCIKGLGFRVAGSAELQHPCHSLPLM